MNHTTQTTQHNANKLKELTQQKTKLTARHKQHNKTQNTLKERTQKNKNLNKPHDISNINDTIQHKHNIKNAHITKQKDPQKINNINSTNTIEQTQHIATHTTQDNMEPPRQGGLM